MAELSESIEVDVPISTAYNQWTQFEDFPEFMDNVKSVRQLDDTHVHWVAEISGKKHEWDAEITFQEPDQQITWRSWRPTRRRRVGARPGAAALRGVRPAGAPSSKARPGSYSVDQMSIRQGRHTAWRRSRSQSR